MMAWQDVDAETAPANGQAPPPRPADLPDWALAGSAVHRMNPVPRAIWGREAEVLWAVGEGLVIFGPDGTAKTTIAANLARARIGADGEWAEVLGLPVRTAKPGRRTLVCALDRPRQILRRYGQVLAGVDGALLDERLVFWKGPPGTLLDKDERWLARHCREAGADMVIVDSLKDAVTDLGEEAALAYNRCVQTAIADGAEVLTLHHTRKAQVGNKKPDRLDDTYGNRFFYAGQGSVIGLYGSPGDAVIAFTHHKQPAEVAGPRRIFVRHDGRVEPFQAGGDLLEAIPPGGWTAREAARHLTGSTSPAENEIKQAERKLEALVARRRLAKLPGTKGGAGGGQPARWLRYEPGG